MDMRSETIALGWHSGFPFYCGKTISEIEIRLRHHRAVARKHPNRPVSTWINACGENIRIELMEIVAPGKDWCQRERHWIGTLRFSFPGGANVTNGGEGTPGLVQSKEHRAKISAALKGRKISEEHRFKLSSREVSRETRLKMSASGKSRRHSVETRIKMSTTRKGMKHTVESRAKMSASQKGRTFTAKHLAKLSATRKGQKRSPETRAKMSAAHHARHFSDANA